MISEKTTQTSQQENLTSEFALYYDEELTKITPYRREGRYFQKAKDRMDRTFDLIKNDVFDRCILDVGASPFYLLYKAKATGARQCHGIYFSNDIHPLRDISKIYSEYGS